MGFTCPFETQTCESLAGDCLYIHQPFPVLDAGLDVRNARVVASKRREHLQKEAETALENKHDHVHDNRSGGMDTDDDHEADPSRTHR